MPAADRKIGQQAADGPLTAVDENNGITLADKLRPRSCAHIRNQKIGIEEVFVKVQRFFRKARSNHDPARRGAKMMVKAFELDTEYGQTGSILVNDVAACAPMEPDACLGRLVLSSRVPSVPSSK